MAVALVKKGDHINLAEKATLVGWTNHRVGAKFQWIQDVAFYDEFPCNVVGKALKKEKGKHTKRSDRQFWELPKTHTSVPNGANPSRSRRMGRFLTRDA